MVSPSGNGEPLAGTQVGVIAPSTVSAALVVKVTIAPPAPVASVVMSAGTVTIGLVVS